MFEKAPRTQSVEQQWDIITLQSFFALCRSMLIEDLLGACSLDIFFNPLITEQQQKTLEPALASWRWRISLYNTNLLHHLLLGCLLRLACSTGLWACYQMHDMQVELLPKLKFQSAFYEHWQCGVSSETKRCSMRISTAPLNTSVDSAHGQLTADGVNHAIKWKIDLLCCHWDNKICQSDHQRKPTGY